MKCIVAAIDLSENSEEVLRWAKLLADKFETSVKVVHIVPDLSAYTGIFLSKSKPIQTVQKELEIEAEEKILWVTKKSLGRSTEYETSVLRGHPVEDLVKFVKSNRASLLVLGCHGHRKPQHQIFGSTAEQLLKRSPCPVVTVGQDFLPHR